jgi:hypothetical protein
LGGEPVPTPNTGSEAIMASDQKQLQLLVRREMARRPLDCSLVDVYCSHGVIYLRGTIRPMRGHVLDINSEISTLMTILRQKSGIRDIINELQTR